VGPVYFLATRAVEQGIRTHVALGARSANDLPYVGRFDSLGVDLHVATDDGTAGHRGSAVDLVAHLTGNPANPPAVYACGPEPMLVALHRLCRERGLPAQLSLERYMKCGFGICGQCALDGYLVCQDGPVFNAAELDGLRDFGRARRSATGRRLPIR
jgi:dihydroorotate dehydrogenase electron transfer subunit